MTDKQLEELIDELNSNPESPKFILMQIAADIYFGKVWLNLPWENQIEYLGDKYYFINRQDFGIIGIIETTSSEMHAYLKPEFRGNGIMCRSLYETILPHSFWYNKSGEQRITIDKTLQGENFRKVEKSAILAGFRNKNVIDGSLFEYVAFKSEYPEFKFYGKENESITEKEFLFLHNRINSINAQLQYMKERFEILFNEEDEIVTSLIKEIEYFELLYDRKIRTLL